MKITFTKIHQEITSVKKSVTQVRVEAGGECFEKAGLPVIEREPSVQILTRTPPSEHSHRFPVQHKKAVSALSKFAAEVVDKVELHKSTNKGNLNQITYSMAEALRGNGCRGRSADKAALQLDDREVRRFIVTQKTAGQRNSTEKDLVIEIGV